MFSKNYWDYQRNRIKLIHEDKIIELKRFSKAKKYCIKQVSCQLTVNHLPAGRPSNY